MAAQNAAELIAALAISVRHKRDSTSSSLASLVAGAVGFAAVDTAVEIHQAEVLFGAAGAIELNPDQSFDAARPSM